MALQSLRAIPALPHHPARAAFQKSRTQLTSSWTCSHTQPLACLEFSKSLHVERVQVIRRMTLRGETCLPHVKSYVRILSAILVEGMLIHPAQGRNRFDLIVPGLVASQCPPLLPSRGGGVHSWSQTPHFCMVCMSKETHCPPPADNIVWPILGATEIQRNMKYCPYLVGQAHLRNGCCVSSTVLDV